MKIEQNKTYSDILDISSQEFTDLNHFLNENTKNNNITELSDEISIFEILKIIENPEEHINSELPQIIENILNSKKLDELNNVLIADLSRLFIQHLKWIKCFPNIKPYYKIDSNNNQELLKILKKLGVNFVCSEESEIDDLLNLQNENNSKNFNLQESNQNLIIFNQNISSINNTSNTSIINFNCSNNSSIVNPQTISLNKILLNKKQDTLDFNPQSEYSEKFINYAQEKNFNYIICENFQEAKKLKNLNPNVRLIFKLHVDQESEITRNEKKRLQEIFQQAEESDLSKNIIGLSLELKNKQNYLNSKKIYELIKRAREIFDDAEETGIDLKLFDLGSPDNENFFNEDNLKLISESLDYFFSDLKIEFICQLGKFFSGSAFTLLTRNIRKPQNEMNLSDYSGRLSHQTNVSSCSNLIGLNSTEISGSNINVSAINQNSSYYLDIDFPEENLSNSSIGNNNFENVSNFNNNFPDDFILNNSVIIESNNLTGKNNNYENEKDYDLKNNEGKVMRKYCHEICCVKDDNNKKNNLKKDLGKKIKECNNKRCLKKKIENNFEYPDSFEDWFIFENVGEYKLCNDCRFNEFIKPEIFYIKNCVSLKLEKYFYCIMNKFES